MFASHGDDGEIATVFYSAAVGPDRAAELGERLEEEFPDIEFEFHPGGPDLYPYLVALE
jgi:uncharacterized protein